MKNYTREDYLSDCKNPDMIHIKDKERFKLFYEELGNDPKQKAQQVVKKRIEFIVPVGNIIELGCHVGFNLIHYAKMGHTITGVDISSTLLREATDRLKKESEEIKNRISLIHSDILDIDVCTLGKFDTVILTETLEHVIEPYPIILKAKELLKPGGKIYIAAPSIRIGTYSHVRGVTEEYLKVVGDEIGLNMKFIEDKSNNIFKNTQAIATLK